MGRKRTVISGRTIPPFFVRSQLSAAEVERRFEHRLSLENITIVPHRAELTSNIASDETEYECSDTDKLVWVMELAVFGRVIRHASRDVIVARAGIQPAVQTTGLRCRRETREKWEIHTIVPVIDVVLE